MTIFFVIKIARSSMYPWFVLVIAKVGKTMWIGVSIDGA
jgi:hypothetical protein